MSAEQEPEDIERLYRDGVNLHQQGCPGKAIDIYTTVAGHFPQAAEVQYNLGLAFFETKQYGLAVDAFGKAANVSPEDSDIFYNLGLACKMDKQYDAAEEAYLKALEFKPDDQDTLYNLGCCYQESGATTQACMVLERVLQLVPDHISAINNLAYLHHLQNNFDRARELYGQVIKLDPDRQSARHMYAALSGEDDQALPQEYVRELFDQYSEHFEKNLIQNLEYNTYKTLRRAFDGVPEKKNRYEHGLDLGCGTGLAGEVFHSACTYLTGVDLSEKMLEQAARKTLYDELYTGDIIEFLNQTNQTFDLIISADVLPYFGNLSPLFSAVAGRTTKDALFCLSSEITKEPKWDLQRTGRYGHNPDYIGQTAAENGFIVLEQSSANIRKENDAWIRGSVFTLGRKH